MDNQAFIIDSRGNEKAVSRVPSNGRHISLASQAGPGSQWAEVGTPGLEAWTGIIRQAYNAELYWPDVAPLYNRVWRSDPEATVARVILSSMAAKLNVQFTMSPIIEKPTDDDKKAVDFGNQVLDDLENGISAWFVSCMSRVPFFGWGLWEAVPCLRKEGWRPPGEDDPWRSSYNDGLVGFRRLAFRHYTSFYSWDLNDRTGRLRGFIQNDPPNPLITIPIERALHCTFGDPDNPEGLATLEAMWRLERYKYNLELIQGIGFEHAAGHAKFTATGELSDPDMVAIRKAARAIMTAQEGNYIALPNNIQGDIIDVNFQAADPLLTAIRYYGILKLALLGMQWAALGTLSPYGSYSQGKDSSDIFISIFNSIAEGQVNQADQQIGRRLFENPVNAAAFPDMTARPVLSVDRAQKIVGLADLGAFLTAMTAAAMPIGDDDWIAIRQKSDFLPETLPEFPTVVQEPDPDAGDDVTGEDVNNPEDASMFAGFRQELVLLQSPDYSDGVMVCLYVPAEMAARMVLDVDGALPAGELHLTLAYLGSVKDMPADQDVLKRVIREIAENVPPLLGNISGMGRFVNPDTQDGKHVIYASYDAPNLPGLRMALLSSLDRQGFKVSRAHGFTPHITLAYVSPAARMPSISDVYGSELNFDKLGYSWGEDRGEYDFIGQPAMLAQRRVALPEDELPIVTEDGAFVTEEDANRAARAFERWAEENSPELAKILRAKVVDELPTN